MRRAQRSQAVEPVTQRFQWGERLHQLSNQSFGYIEISGRHQVAGVVAM